MSFDRYRQYTQARIGLGNVGAGLPTQEWLEFSYHHAAAVDAIRAPWRIEAQEKELASLGFKTQQLTSDVKNREEYLLRPDRGRRLSEASRKSLHASQTSEPNVMIVASNGLSSFAITNHLSAFLKELCPSLKSAGIQILEDHIFLVADARVAIVDDLGDTLKPTLGMILIGERPGLSSPDSLALYLTHTPQKGRSDADRNCISNIRNPHGLSYTDASFKAMFLIQESIRRGLSGVNLKDESNLLQSDK